MMILLLQEKEFSAMFGSLGTTELILILAIVILLFGVGRVSKIGGEVGSAVREFRKGLKGDGGDSNTR
jgi:sec-independent protein translocase protein TatA